MTGVPQGGCARWSRPRRCEHTTVGSGDEQAPVVPAHLLDPGVELDWEPEVVSVGAQIVGHGVLGRGLRACAREGHAGQVAEAGWGEQPQRVPPLSPAGAHLVTGVEDNEVAAAAP